MNELPHNLHIEKIILGCLIQNNSIYDTISNIISAEDFFEQIYIKLYEVISNKLENGQIADSITLFSFVEENDLPSAFFKDLTENVFVIENIKQYAEILSDLSIRRKLIQIGTTLIDNANSSQKINEQIEFAENNIFQLQNNCIDNKRNKLISLTEGVQNVFQITKNSLNNNKKISGITTGIDKLDETIGGLKKGEIFVLAGRPSTGKTAFSVNIALRAALDKKYGGKSVFISLEMPYEQICYRSISFLSGVPLFQLMHSKISMQNLENCIEALNRFKDLPFYIYDSSYLTISTIRNLLRQLKRKNMIDFVIIDYLQLIDSNSKNESREQEISKISRSLKLMAKEIEVPIIVLSQLSRDIEKRSSAPKLSDLRGSGAVEQDADIVGFLYREDDENRNKVNLVIAKNRNGALCEIPLFFDGETTTFSTMIPNEE